MSGALGRIRTCDLWLRKPTLYPTELRAHARTKTIANNLLELKFVAKPINHICFALGSWQVFL